MIKGFLKKIKTKDGKILFENFLSLTALEVFGKIFPLITFPYILRVVGFEKYGIIVFASSLVLYFQTITDFSFKITAVREVATFKSSQNKLNIIYSKVITIKLILLFLSWGVITLIVYLSPSFLEYFEIYLYSSLMLLGTVLFPEWFFQGIEKMRYITYLNLGIKIFFTICIFIFIKNENDFWIYPLLQSAGYIGAGIVGQYLLVKKYNIRFVLLKKRILKNTITSNTPIFVNQFMPMMYNNTSVFLLGIMGTQTLLGIYKAILTVVNLGIMMLGVLSRVFFPYLNRKKNTAFVNYKKMMLIIGTCLVVGLILSNQIVFWYLDLNYEHAFTILVILSLGVLGYALYDIFGVNYYIIKRKDKLVMKNTIIVSIIGFIAAFPLIGCFSIFGAAINLTIARGLMGGTLWIKYLKDENH